MSGARSRNKGARGEREVLEQYRAAQFTGTRGFQSGGQGGGDIAGNMPDVPEVKLAERGTFWPWIEQAQSNAGEARQWVLWIRSNRRPWVVTLSADRYLELLQTEREAQARQLRRGQL